LTNSLELDMLVHIATLKDPNKKQVCQEMLIESSTGVEIAKRLVAKGFIEEKADSKDRRAARLSLTVKGQQTVLQGYTQLAPIHSDILNTLRTQVPPLS
jgi:DNA-binding MarR family transcriptional regulator